MKFWSSPSTITLGKEPKRFFPRTIRIPTEDARVHHHIIGVSGAGKSRYLAHLYFQLVEAGFGYTLIDPHGDLAELLFAHISRYGSPATRDQTI
jgi:hypothetical protein